MRQPSLHRPDLSMMEHFLKPFPKQRKALKKLQDAHDQLEQFEKQLRQSQNAQVTIKLN